MAKSKSTPPPNPLCEEPRSLADVIDSARNVVAFVRDTDNLQDPDGLRYDDAYRQGRDLVLAMVGGALDHAYRLACTEQARP